MPRRSLYLGEVRCTGNFNYFSALTISGTGNTSELSAPYAHMGYTPPSGNGTIDRYTYSYDAAGRLVAIDRLNSDSATFEHDDTDQLTGADWDGTTPDENYSYDENGNRTNTGYTTGDNNRLLTDGTYNYTYDAEGNRTRRTSIADGSYTVYEWDYHNRLVSVTDFDVADTMLQKVSYTYDIFGRLIGRELDANGDTVVDESGTFIYDGDQILLVLDETGEVDHRLLWGAAVDQILADENSSGDVNWMLIDHQNTVRDIVQYDETTYTTAVVNHLAYDAFGNATTETDPSLDVFNLQYTARYFDEATGLQYNNARWYDAATGQWMSQDPISFAAGDENLYRYVGNSVVSLTDPSGLAPPGLSAEGPDGRMYPVEVLDNLTPAQIAGMIARRGGGATNDPAVLNELLNHVARTYIGDRPSGHDAWEAAARAIEAHALENGDYSTARENRLDFADAVVNRVEEMGGEVPGARLSSLHRGTSYGAKVGDICSHLLLAIAARNNKYSNQGVKSHNSTSTSSSGSKSAQTANEPLRYRDKLDEHVAASKPSQRDLGNLPKRPGSTTTAPSHTGYHPAPKDIPGIPGLTKVKSKTPVQGGGGLRARWTDSKGNIFEWDSQHRTMEMYNRKGRHLGEFCPDTGNQTKPADPSRSIKKYL